MSKRKLREVPDDDIRDSRYERCILKEALHMHFPPDSTITLECPIHGKHVIENGVVRKSLQE